MSIDITLTANGRNYTVLHSLLKGSDESREWLVILQGSYDMPLNEEFELNEEDEMAIIEAIHRNGMLPFVAPRVEPSEFDCTGRWCPSTPWVDLYDTSAVQDPSGDLYFTPSLQIHVSQSAYLDV